MDKDKIEIRSKSLQNFIREIPPRLVCTGNLIILAVMAALFVMVCTVHYPYNIECQGVVRSEKSLPATKVVAYLNIPYKYAYLFDEVRLVEVSLEGDPNHLYSCKIRDVSKSSRKIGGKNYFIGMTGVEIPYSIKGEINCSATILIENKTLWNLVFH